MPISWSFMSPCPGRRARTGRMNHIHCAIPRGRKYRQSSTHQSPRVPTAPRGGQRSDVRTDRNVEIGRCEESGTAESSRPSGSDDGTDPVVPATYRSCSTARHERERCRHVLIERGVAVSTASTCAPLVTDLRNARSKMTSSRSRRRWERPLHVDHPGTCARKTKNPALSAYDDRRLIPATADIPPKG